MFCLHVYVLLINSNFRSVYLFVFFFKQKTAYEMRISDWSSDVCSSDLGSTGCRRRRSMPTRRFRAHRRTAAFASAWAAPPSGATRHDLVPQPFSDRKSVV